MISQVKLIAEPWDVGEGGYQVGKFPALWAEWNGRYRDMVRRYWKGDDGQLGDLGYRLTGSQRPLPARWPPSQRQHQLRHRPRRLHPARPGQLRRKHNEANGEENRDGSNDNHSLELRRGRPYR